MATKITTDEDKSRIYSLLAARNEGDGGWFRCETGFRFIWDNSDAVVIGWGGWRDFKNEGDLYLDGKNHSIVSFQAIPKNGGGTLVTAYLYKGEWHMTDIERMLEEEKPGESSIVEI